MADIELNDWPDVPDYCEPLVGWRRWGVVDGKLRGCDIGSDVAWPPKQQIEARHSRRWSAPSVKCSGSPCSDKCGIYAYRTEDYARQETERDFTNNNWWNRFVTSIPLVIGQVWLWGRIVEHTNGWRAQYAYPKKFVAAHKCDAAVLAETYGITYEESASWKSVIQNVESSQSRSPYPDPYSYPFVPSQSQITYQTTHLWWRNQPGYQSQSPLAAPSSSSLLIQPVKAESSFDLSLSSYASSQATKDCKHESGLSPKGVCDDCGLYLTRQEIYRKVAERKRSGYYNIGPKPLLINVEGA